MIAIGDGIECVCVVVVVVVAAGSLHLVSLYDGFFLICIGIGRIFCGKGFMLLQLYRNRGLTFGFIRAEGLLLALLEQRDYFWIYWSRGISLGFIGTEGFFGDL